MARSLAFTLPPERNATAPPERRGLRRDHVRLLVLDRTSGALHHARFFELGCFLAPGDLLVLNNSRTIPAALPAWFAPGRRLEVRLHRRLGPDRWESLILPSAGPDAGMLAARAPVPSAVPVSPGDELCFGEGLTAVVEAVRPQGPPLARLRFSRCGRELTEAFYRLGQPVRYEYAAEPWDLDYYQTVYANCPGSVEMPSAGRAFTWELLLRLQRQGVGLAYLRLHAGLSYYGDDRWPPGPRESPEPFTIPAETAQAINSARSRGGRIIAVGTTVVRALEHAGRHGGPLTATAGWTDLYVAPGYRLQVVDGLLTGLHEPEASHLDMLAAFVAPDHLRRAYTEALAQGYLWHEFGDMNLILPLSRPRPPRPARP